MTQNRINRRDFVLGAAGAGLLASTPLFGQAGGGLNRVGLVGTGIRGTKFWGKYLLDNYGDVIEYAGLSDVNPGRLAFSAGVIGTDCPQYTDFDRMLDEANLDTLIVTTVDSTHHEFIVKGLERGLTVITEKPMTTDEVRCQAIIDAEKNSSGRLLVGLNYRYGKIHSRLKEILLSEKIGRLTSVDFHWYLNTYHGASYFRRWHGLRDKSGTLLRGRYLEKAGVEQLVVPGAVLDDLLETVFTVQNYVVLGLLMLSLATVAVITLVFLLSHQLRRGEILTLRRMGASRGFITVLVASEIAFVFVISLLLAAALTWVVRSYATQLLLSLLTF